MELSEESYEWGDNQYLNIVWIRPPLLVKVLPRQDTKVST